MSTRSFFLFAAFNFTHYSIFKPAAFHELMYQKFQDFVVGSAQKAPWIAYREGAKTCIAKIALGLLIAGKYVIDALRHNSEDQGTWGDWLYIDVGSDDKANAESILFHVVTELQANQLLIAGFGHLYYQATEENPDAGATYTNNRDAISFYMTISKRGFRPKPGSPRGSCAPVGRRLE